MRKVQIKIGKVVFTGVIVGIANTIWGWLTCGWLFNWVYRIEPTGIWKPDTDMPFGLMTVTSLIFSIFLVFIYALIYKSLPGKGIAGKGLCFGLIVWLIGALPGNAVLGMCTMIAPAVIVYWIISFLIVDLWKGLIIAAIYGSG